MGNVPVIRNVASRVAFDNALLFQLRQNLEFALPIYLMQGGDALLWLDVLSVLMILHVLEIRSVVPKHATEEYVLLLSYLHHHHSLHPQLNSNAVSAIVETMSVPLMRPVVAVVPLVHVEKVHVCFVVLLVLALQLHLFQLNNAIFAAFQIMYVILMRLVVVVVPLVLVEKAHVCLVVLLVLVFQSTGLRKEIRHFLPQTPLYNLTQFKPRPTKLQVKFPVGQSD